MRDFIGQVGTLLIGGYCLLTVFQAHGFWGVVLVFVGGALMFVVAAALLGVFQGTIAGLNQSAATERTEMRELVATIVALVVIILTGGNGPVGILVWLAVWMIWPERREPHMSAERRYRMRETERRNESLQRWRETRRLLNSRDLTKM